MYIELSKETKGKKVARIHNMSAKHSKFVFWIYLIKMNKEIHVNRKWSGNKNTYIENMEDAIQWHSHSTVLEEIA